MSIRRTGIALLMSAAALSIAPGLRSGMVLPRQTGQTAEAAGLLLESLSAEDLNDLQAQTGRRFGVEIIQVRPGTAGAAAGLKEGDILTAINGAGVDSAAKAAALLRAASGETGLTVISLNLSTLQLESKTVRIRLGGAAAGQGQAPPVRTSTAGGRADAAAAGAQGGDPIEAYFDLMDFSCSQAWNRRVVTPAQDRRRVASLLQQSWEQLDASAQAQIMSLPGVWTALQKSWTGMSEAERNKKRAEWRDQILLPNNYFAPPSQLQRFTAQGDLLSFEYPAAWTGGWQVVQETPLLFVGPGVSQASWDKVLNTQTSPAGALFALVPLNAQTRRMSFVQGARFLTQQLMPGAASNFREVAVTPIGQAGAILTLRGQFPGESEEQFYWIGITAFGSDQVFVGRMGGRISQAMDLLPGFHHMLSTLQLHPPQAAGSGGSVMGSWEVAYSKVSTAIVANIWK